MSDATYKLLRTVGGVTYFASVGVHAETGYGQIEVVADLSSPNADEGEISAVTEPTWVDAAISGVLFALSYLSRTGRLPGGCQIRITRIVGAVLDTRDDVVESAAVIATLLAVDSTSYISVKPTFDGFKWKVELNL